MGQIRPINLEIPVKVQPEIKGSSKVINAILERGNIHLSRVDDKRWPDEWSDFDEWIDLDRPGDE